MTSRILLVDDNCEFRSVIKEMLGRHFADLEIHEAGSGDEAIELAGKITPHVVVMDIRLPKMNGIIAAQAIREKVPQGEIVLLTMFDSQEYKRMSFQFNFKAYINKSEIYDRLIPVIRNSLKENSCS